MSGQPPPPPPPLVVCGPSGVGKSVLIAHLRAAYPGRFGFSVSHTTRAPRPGEEEGVAYHFTDLATMRRGVEAGLFVESATVHGNMYGTSREAVGRVGRSGRICILDIDVQGAESVARSGCLGRVRCIFLRPPSMAELERRLRGRGTEAEDAVKRRLAGARRELEVAARASFFDHTFVLEGLGGGRVPQAVHELCALLEAWYPALAGAVGPEAGPGGAAVASLRAREVFDSLGRPAVEVDVVCCCAAGGGLLSRASAPSAGARDAVALLNGAVGAGLLGLDVARQGDADALLAAAAGGTHAGAGVPRLARGAALAASAAFCRAGAASSGAPLHAHLARLAGRGTGPPRLPVPALQALGAAPAGGGCPALREVLQLPFGFGGFAQALAAGVEVHAALLALVRERFGRDACGVGDRGGPCPALRHSGEALDLLAAAIERAGHAGRVGIGVAVAAAAAAAPGVEAESTTEAAAAAGGRPAARPAPAAHAGWIGRYPLVLSVDPAEAVGAGVLEGTGEVGKAAEAGEGGGRAQAARSPAVGLGPRGPAAAAGGARGALALEPHRVGTVTGAIEAADAARGAGWAVAVSHDAGDTEDTFTADLAVGLRCGQMKAGAPCRSEWLAKYNELIRIEESLGSMSSFAGDAFHATRAPALQAASVHALAVSVP